MKKKKSQRTIHVPKNKSKKQNKVKNKLHKKIVITTVEPKCKKVKIIDTVVVGKKRRRKKSTGIIYFSQDTENAIIEYNGTDDLQRRNDLYNNRIKYPFEKLVENIFNTFKFSYFETGPLEVQRETVAHLVANMHKFQSDKGKAFCIFFYYRKTLFDCVK